MAAGIDTRHTRTCRSREGGRCNCAPTYQAHIFDSRTGKRVRRTFPTRSAAKLWRQDAVVALRAGTLAAARPDTPRIGDYAAEWLQGARDGTIASRRGEPYKPSAIRGYERVLRLHVLPAFGHLRLHELRRRDVQDLADRLAAAGKTRSTIQNALNPLQAMYRRALRRDMVTVNPTAQIDLRATGTKRDRIATPDEAAELLAALPADERALWATAMYAGLRSGELRALKWTDVDLAGGVIRVERGWDDVEGEIDGKTRAARRAVPIAAALRDHLVEHRMRQDWPDDALVFGASPTMPFYRSTPRSRSLAAWKRENAKRIEAAEDAGVDAELLEPIGMHECRHTFASLMIAAGVNAKALSTWMGHASVSITFDRYGHMMPGGEAEGAALLDAYLERATTSARLAALASSARQ